MKKEEPARCPGCGKHCPLSAPRCKYGRACAARLEAKTEKNSCKHKWEGHVAQDGVLWHLLHISRKMKKNLCHKRTTEAQLLSALSCVEQEYLLHVLKKLQDVMAKPE